MPALSYIDTFSYRKSNRGFTLVELVVTIILLAILAAYAAPRLDISVFERRGYYQQALAALRHAQKQAVAANCITSATFTETNCTVTKVGCGGFAVTNPVTGLTNFCNDSKAINVSGNTTINFDRLGVGVGTLTIDGVNIVVNANTGFIQTP